MTAESIENEQRHFIRVPAKRLVHYQKNELPLEDQDQFQSYHLNISEGGIRIESHVPYPIGTILIIELNVEGWDYWNYRNAVVNKAENLITLSGKVLWVETLEPHSKYDIGVSFIGLDKITREAILDYIESLN